MARCGLLRDRGSASWRSVGRWTILGSLAILCVGVGVLQACAANAAPRRADYCWAWPQIRDADYVVVAPDSFHAALQPLLDLRASPAGGAYHVGFLSVDTLRMCPMLDPWTPIDSTTIWSFLLVAHDSWAIPPRFILLVGASVYAVSDPRRTQIPTWHDPWLSSDFDPENIAMDAPYGVYRGLPDTGLASVVVARIPASTVAEVSAYVTKLMSYVNQGPSAAWKTRALHLIDDRAIAGQCGSCVHAYAEGILSQWTAMEPGWTTTTYHRTAYVSHNEACQAFTCAVNQGVGFIWSYGSVSNYWVVMDYFFPPQPENHGNVWRDYFDTQDSLTANGAYPVILGSVCGQVDFDYGATSRYAQPPLAPLWLLDATRGPIAWIGPTREQYDITAYHLSQMIFDELFRDRGPDTSSVVLGEKFLRAIQRIAAAHPDERSLLRSIVLLGDPALVIQTKVVNGAGGGRGCPMLETSTANGWQVENSILGRSTDGAFLWDSYHLQALPWVRPGVLQLRVRENEQDATTLDAAEAVVIDHPQGTAAFAVGDGFLVGTRVPAVQVRRSTGEDITAQATGCMGSFVGGPGDTLLVDLGPGSGSQRPHIAPVAIPGGLSGGMVLIGGEKMESELRPGATAQELDAGLLATSGILIQAPDGLGAWRTVQHYYPREQAGEFAVDSLDHGMARLVFLGRHTLEYVGRIVPVGGAASPQTATLRSARHSRRGDVTQAVLGADSVSVPIVTGDTLTFEYALPAAAGLVRDYFFVSRGVYTSPQTNQVPVPVETGPTKFSLYRNRPNPFSRTTAIGFDLPSPCKVRLDVYDVQGRHVRQLANGPYQAGNWTATWDRRTGSGSWAPAGVYFYRIQAGSFHEVRKMVVLR